MQAPSALSDAELRNELKELGFDAGPVSPMTRSVLEKKLLKLRGDSTIATGARRPSKSPSRGRKPSPKKTPDTSALNTSKPTPSPPKSSPRRSSSRSSSTSSRRSSRNITTPVAIAAAEQSENEADNLIAQPKASTFKRTPTPPRPSLSAQRAFTAGGQHPVTRSTVGSTVTRRLYSDLADDDDESMESSRVLSSTERRGYNQRPRSTYAPPQKGDSPIDKLKRFGASAYQYFQEKTGRVPYVRHSSERGKFGTPGGRLSPAIRPREVSPSATNDIPKWLVMIFGSFTLVLLLAYAFTAYPKTIARTGRVISGAVSDTVSFLYNYAIFPVLVLALIVAAAFVTFYVYKKRKIARETFERRTMELVDKIADRVRDAGEFGVSEQHLRDTFFPPTRRTQPDRELWSNAVAFINNMDSRMRSEKRLINGVECDVWIWVNAHDLSRGWQGLAERTSPKPNFTPTQALTRCLKIRGLVEDRSDYDVEVKREVYAKLQPISPIHFSIHHAPNESCVYMMFSNLDHAKRAFDTFHTQWIRGNLVSVKYVRDERYAERFPEVAGK